MNEPERLLDEEAGGFSHRLLAEAKLERPSAELSSKMLVGVSAGAAVGLAGESANAASHSVAPPAPLVGTSGTKAFLGSKALLWTGAGVGVAVAVLSASFSRVFTSEEGSAPRSEEQTQSSSEPPVSGVEAVSLKAEEPAPQALDERPPAKEAVAPKKVTKRVVGGADRLQEELSLLEKARKSLADERPADALRLLQQYNYRFPRGKLKQEATVLRVQALTARGNDTEAAHLSEEFLRDNPDSAHKRRLAPSTQKK